MNRFYNIALIAFCFVIAISCAVTLEHLANKHAQAVTAALESSLRSAGVEVPPGASLPALRLIYSRLLAQRAPLMDLAGTDSADLTRAADQLERTEAALEKAQTNASDAAAIQSLYPIGYLRALADLEAAREAFVASGTQRESDRYDAALSAAIATGRSDLHSFEIEFNRYARATPGRFPTLGDTISTDSMSATLQKIDHGFDALSRAVQERTACLDGALAQCDPALLRVPVPAAAGAIHEPVPSAEIERVRSLLAAATKDSSYATSTMVVLEESVCEGAYTRGHFAYLPPLVSPVRPTLFLNELFFIPTANNTAGLSVYMRDVLGMSYSRVNPSIFYLCPDTGNDSALMGAVQRTAEFAKAHPSIASHLREPLLSGITVRESDARTYLRAALADATDTATTADLSTIALMFNDRGANLETTVWEIAHIDARDVSLQTSGIPFDLSARDLYLTHSAFPTLFQFYNPSFGTDGRGLRSHDPAASASLSLQVVPYSELRTRISDVNILRDLERFFTFEQIES